MIWMGVLLVLVLFVQSFGGRREAPGEAIAYSDFVRQVDEQNVQSVTTSATASGNQAITGKLNNGEVFRTTAPADAQVTERLIQKGVQVQAKEAEQSSFWLIILYQSLPFILILGISFFIMRQMQKNAGGGAMGFGKSGRAADREARGRCLLPTSPASTRPAKSSRNRRISQGSWQVRAARRPYPKGALLVGSPAPANLLARAIAGEAGVPFFTISGSISSRDVRRCRRSRVRDMLDLGQEVGPCLVFIDEIDASSTPRRRPRQWPMTSASRR